MKALRAFARARILLLVLPIGFGICKGNWHCHEGFIEDSLACHGKNS